MSVMKMITLEEEMEKNPRMKLSDIQLLREWCEKQPHLPKVEDNFLALFLHANDYQMEATKNTIENYYTIRTHSPEFSNRDPLQKELQQTSKVSALFPLNGKTKDGYSMIYGTLLDPDPSHYVFNDNMKYGLMLYDLLFLMDGTNEGYVYISDISQLSFGHSMKMNPLALKRFMAYIQKAAPLRLKRMHAINASPFTKFLVNMMKPFMKKELIDIMHFHSSMDSVSEYIPIDALPNEVGGKGGSVHELAKIQVKKLEDYREWFLLDEATRRVNEALRIDKSKSANDSFDEEGSSKQHDID